MLRYTGLHHFAVEIENMEQSREQIEKAGAVHRPYPGTEEMAKRGNVEVKFTGPDGVRSTCPSMAGSASDKPLLVRPASGLAVSNLAVKSFIPAGAVFM
jgi:hypothetical protein